MQKHTTCLGSVQRRGQSFCRTLHHLARDAYRGYIMLVLVSGGFGLADLAKRRPEFTGIANQFDHMPWEWITFWDLIQPAFMFIVGVAMPFALAHRRVR